MRRGLVVLSLIAISFSLASPALACGCDSKPLGALLEDADAVFAIAPLDHGEILSSGSMTVAVTRVYKGDIGTTVEVWATEGPSACGVEPDQTTAVGLLSSEKGGKMRIGTCLPRYSIADIEEILGAGHEPGTTLAVLTPGSPLLLFAAASLAALSSGALITLRARRRRGHLP